MLSALDLAADAAIQARRARAGAADPLAALRALARVLALEGWKAAVVVAGVVAEDLTGDVPEGARALDVIPGYREDVGAWVAGDAKARRVALLSGGVLLGSVVIWR
jgi:hypothetical protein